MERLNGETKRPTALVTGASGGIGREFAILFARHGFDLVIVARNEEKLGRLAAVLSRRYGGKVMPIAADLTDENAAEQVYEKTRRAGIFVDQLVNNAGAGKQASTVDAEPDTLKELIHLNAVSVTLLCRLYGADMVRAGHGRILNVASLGAFIPDPYFNVYGPTKAFELFLTEAMYGELSGTGVSVSVLCPGPVKTNWAKNAGKADSRAAKDPSDIARAGFEGMQKGRLLIVPAPLYRLAGAGGTGSASGRGKGSDHREMAGRPDPKGGRRRMTRLDQCHTGEEIAPHTWRIDEAGLANCYLLEGGDAALLIDTACGADDLSRCVARLTDKPLTVAVTHRHPDHVGGAWRFGGYYANPDDRAAIYSLMCGPAVCRAMRKSAGCPGTRAGGRQRTPVTDLEDGHCFDLGGRIVLAKSVPGHTRGSMIFADRGNRLLFTGDDINPNLWMHLPGCTSLETWCGGADRILALMRDGFSAWNGHGDGRQTLEQAEKTRTLVSELLEKQRTGELRARRGCYPAEDALVAVRYRR